MSDITPKRTLAIIDERDNVNGYRRCALTGTTSQRIVPQHRQGGAGGRANKHRPANVVWIDSLVNGDLEADPRTANVGTVTGVKISLHADPEKIPVFFAFERAWFVLEGESRRQIRAREALEMMAAFYGPAYFAMQRDVARRGWVTRADDSLTCATIGALVVCGRGSSGWGRAVDGLSFDASWDRVNCPACIAYGKGEWS